MNRLISPLDGTARIYERGQLRRYRRWKLPGWLLLSDGQTSVRVFDLSSQLDLVQSGQVDVALGPDTAVDWAMVRVRITISN